MGVGPCTRKYLRLVGISALTAVGIAVLGYFPTVQIAGPAAVPGMLVAIGASLLAGLLGAAPISLAMAKAPDKTPQAVLASTALRFVVILALAAALILCGWFDRLVVGVWIGISYMILLAVDTMFVVRSVAGVQGRGR